VLYVSSQSHSVAIAATASLAAGVASNVGKDCDELVRQALGGDQSAWNALVGGLSAVALKVARVYRLGDADARDVCQSTWLRDRR
jgi:hypothetical protein